MAGKIKDRKGAIFIATEDGKEKLLGYKARLYGVPGIAYMKDDKLIGFKPLSELIEEFTQGVFLTIAGTKLDSSAKMPNRHTGSMDQPEKKI